MEKMQQTISPHWNSLKLMNLLELHLPEGVSQMLYQLILPFFMMKGMEFGVGVE